MAPIGFSTGALYKTGMPMEDRLALYRGMGADAVELNFLRSDELFRFRSSSRLRELLGEFRFVSLHAPDKDVVYDASARPILERIAALTQELPIRHVALHPHKIVDYDLLKSYSIPFALENLNAGKRIATDARWFRQSTVETEYGFLIDVQHVHEHDPTMRLAEKLADAMGDRLAYLHVSGRDRDNSHLPLYRATNREDIAPVVPRLPDVPIILEGVVGEDIEQDLRTELEYVTGLRRGA